MIVNKQTYFANANGHAYKTMQDFVQYNTMKLPKTYETFTSDVKVALLTYVEELLIRNLCLMLLFRAHLVRCFVNRDIFRLKRLILA